MATPSQQKGTRKRRQANDEKLEKVLQLLHSMRWSIRDFIYYAFRIKDEDGKVFTKRSPRHSKMASKFLGGFCNHTPAKIVELWVKH
jgi:hypothetical protein